jgi:hypothetical protein
MGKMTIFFNVKVDGTYSVYSCVKGNIVCELQIKVSRMKSEIIIMYPLFRLDS